MKRFLLILLMCLNLIGCEAGKGLGELVRDASSYFLGGEDNAVPPNELVEYEPEIEAEILWKKSIGVGHDGYTLKLAPALKDEKIIAADREGLVEARKIDGGDLIWETETDRPITGGVGLGTNSVIAGTSDGEVIALEIETGKIIWTARVSSEVLAKPIVNNGVVIVRTVDGRTVALRESSGEQIWEFEKTVPALTIRGTGMPVIVEDTVVGGYANGKLIALRLADGKHVWETSVAIPKGRSEIERLVDLDGDLLEVDDVIFVPSYQGGISAVLALDGDLLWNNDKISSSSGFSYDWRYLYLSDLEGDVWQLDQRSGGVLWKQKELHQRKLTAPASHNDFVVVGDFEGYLHWLSDDDGRQLGRIRITDEPITVQPLVKDGVVFVYASDGTLAAVKSFGVEKE
ncbi:MAG: outer membrane protein assembly factor BamB [Gammaproteobacteria bacterium]